MNLEAHWVQLRSFSFHFGPAFHVSSNFQIFTLSAAKGFFILILIFKHLWISRISRFWVTLRAVEWFFILVLIFMYLQILRFEDLEQLNGFSFWSWISCTSRSSDLQIYSSIKSSWMGYHFVLIFMHLQILRFGKTDSLSLCL